MSVSHPILPVNLVSSLLLLAGVTISLWYWSTKKDLTDAKLIIAFGGLVGAFVGAKVCYFIAEAPIWWDDPVFWIRMLAGKTILGGLLGGWAGVEITKWSFGISQIMGDEFARIIPIGIAIGRVGCWLYGCCPGRPVATVVPDRWSSWFEGLGVSEWPAPWMEILFQLSFWLGCLATRNIPWLKGQQFHAYLITYGAFRLWHENFRATVRYPGTQASPYMILAALVVICGVLAFWRRRNATKPHLLDAEPSPATK